MKRPINNMFLLGVFVCLLAGVSHSTTITDNDFIALHRASSYSTGSGLGGLDFVLFAGATSGNSIFDDSFTSMPGVSSFIDAYFITSVGDLRTFYTQQFIDNGSVIDEVMIFMDLNESVESSVNFDLMDIIHENTDVYGDDRDNPGTTDISSVLQNATTTATGGTVLAEYATDSSFTTTKGTIENGSGWADYGVRTGINPFDVAYADADRLVFHLQYSSLTNGAEEIFLSGEYSTADIINEEVPEPATMALLALGGLFLRRRRA